MNIALQLGSGPEWRALKKIFYIKDHQVRTQPYGEYFISPLEGFNCFFYFSRRTKTRAAGACQYAISNWKPKIVINLGTCAAVKSDIRIGDLILADKTIQFDCYDRLSPNPTEVLELMSTQINYDWLKWNPYREDFHKGLIATADQDLTAENLVYLHEIGALATDWESGAITKISELNLIPAMVLRAVVDVPLKLENPEDHYRSFQINTPIMIEKLLSVLPDILRAIDRNALKPSKD